MSRNSHHNSHHSHHHHAHHGPTKVFGSWGADVLAGTAGRDIIFGLWGDDEISSGAGNDIVHAGFGDDLIIGGAGNNRYFGGHGLDTVSYAGSITDYELNAGCRPWSPISITRLDGAAEGAGVDRLHSIEAIYFAADDYTFHLDGTNNAVLAGDDAFATDEDTALVIEGADLLANDLEFDGDAMAITGVDATSASGASVSLSGGQITYDAGGIFDALGEGDTAEDTFTYTVDDGKGGTDTATVTVSITGVNDAPSIIAPVSVSVAENTTDILAVIGATDAENDAITYGISGGVDAAFFAIDASTGALTFLGAPDFETPLDDGGDNIYDVEVSATDTGGASDTAAIAIEVTDVAEGPGFEMRLNELHYDNAGG
ncbi:MAG: VCBS repeat-containing protein, partial [Halocynthiibacter sp.]